MSEPIGNIKLFENILRQTNWDTWGGLNDPTLRVDGRTSIAYAADFYLTLNYREQSAAHRLILTYKPPGWYGWKTAVDVAKKRKRAFSHAIDRCMLSDNPQDDNYCGRFLYSHDEKARYVFKDRRTQRFVGVICSRPENVKRAVGRILGF